MNRIHIIGRLGVFLAGLASSLLAFWAGTVPAAFAAAVAPLGGDPRGHPGLPYNHSGLPYHHTGQPVPASPPAGPPSWNKHPPLPAHLHPLATSGIPGWQQALMAVTVVLLAAVLVTIAHPGPGRPTAAQRTHRPSDDHQPRHPDPQDQPAAPARPIPARQNHRPGPRP